MLYSLKITNSPQNYTIISKMTFLQSIPNSEKNQNFYDGKKTMFFVSNFKLYDSDI